LKIVFLVCLSLILFSGCVTVISPSNLYWGNYSVTLYNVKKEPGEASNNAHEKELQSIVKKSNELNLKIPPGVYAELGVYAKTRGDYSAAQNYFGLEQETYPEGAALMQRILKNKPNDS